jgi:hypothetical protein
VKGGPNLPDQLALPVWPGTIRQQNNGNLRFQIDPERATAESQVAD